MRAFEVDHVGHPALGYLIGSRASSGLKTEYQHLDGMALRDLAKSGIAIKADPIETIEVAYTGDTCARGLLKPSTGAFGESILELNSEDSSKQRSALYLEQLFHAELLLCELTFLDSTENECDRSMASERGHLHICDLEQVFSFYEHWEDANIKKSACTADSNDNDKTNAARSKPCVRPVKNIVFLHLSARHKPASRALGLIAKGLPRKLRSRCHVAISSLLSNEEKSLDVDSFVTLIQPNGCISLTDYISWNTKCL